MIAKVIKKQDAYFKLKPAKSGETSLNISNDIAGYLGGKEGYVKFRIFRTDFILAFANIIRLLPLYKTTSKSYDEISLDANFCDSLYKEIDKYFQGADTASYTVFMHLREDGRNYLNNLNNGSFNLRNYLVELHNKIVFEKDSDKTYNLRILSQFGEYEQDDNSLPEELPKVVEKKTFDLSNYPLQQITYGAPGTGKSYGISDIIESVDHVRTTFHPDSDYASFVGAYKPTMSKQKATNGYSVDEGYGHDEEQIVYKFVPQAFTKAYIKAWENYPDDTILIIEEINRGNCAQIFGDLFQLLDRDDSGFSSYPIEADADIANYIANEMKLVIPVEDKNRINQLYEKSYPEGIIDKIKNGELLLLPDNLRIWATMNTSDQSLFPIDSAFKRRWDWKFVKISDAHKNWTIHFGDEACDWWEFIKQMNRIIAKETSSDDKKLGYFFCKPSNEDEDFINEERFVGKVLFYLWNDVFKDGETKYFKVTENPDDEPTFEAFYNDDCTPCVAAVRKFIVGIVGEENVHKIGEQIIPQQVFDDFKNKIDYTKYSFDGKDRLSKKVLGESIVLKYINEHINDTFDALQKVLSFGDKVPTKYQYKGIIVQSEYITGSYVPCFGEEHTSSDGVKYKILTWWNKYNVDFIINFAKQQGWTVTEVND